MDITFKVGNVIVAFVPTNALPNNYQVAYAKTALLVRSLMRLVDSARLNSNVWKIKSETHVEDVNIVTITWFQILREQHALQVQVVT